MSCSSRAPGPPRRSRAQRPPCARRPEKLQHCQQIFFIMCFL